MWMASRPAFPRRLYRQSSYQPRTLKPTRLGPSRRPSQAEDVSTRQQRLGERVDVRGLGGDADARARGRAHSETAHQGLRAVVAGPDANSQAVGKLGDVVGVDALDGERGEPAACIGRRGPNDSESGDLRE